MNHFEIERTMFFRDPGTGNYIRVDKDNAAETKPEDCYIAFGPRTTVEPRAENLLAAAPMMYQQLTMQAAALAQLMAQLDALPAPTDDLRRTFEQLQNGCMLAQQVAQHGIDAVAKGLDAEMKTK